MVFLEQKKLRVAAKPNLGKNHLELGFSSNSEMYFKFF